MKARPVLKVIFKVLFLLIIICVSSCKKNNSIENTFKKNEAFTKNEEEETIAFFFIETANIGKTIISKSQIAQQKSSENSIVILGKKIENNQNRLLQEITELANKKLLIISEINASHRRDTYELITANSSNFDRVYLNSMKKCLEEQIKLLENVSKETNDKIILKLVLKYLPEQFDLLRETEAQIKNKIKKN
ncbi:MULTISPECIES: DUF4142 domain-containing protein [Flavobacterium]|jgi:predicted outer membrane protein|uniref:Hypothetical lipoprotein n=1 Tax=Flavobacterium johnsoniae (strain ATCC 17061 / DSM 2064 / JCM 8514 / BCRC 14874 / CCUG 350202 / NBRC 14942 / NCIMB 11054 / UW101) TaxID=376686 RepID=A5FHH4_FLAJ1|nr:MULTISPECIES: DUF4142 domain-containing protein [Flavobacterium]ABQ05342.1 hypothetical lipoprotein [Flavobacterium johnsoniae UW101]OXE94989.1 hypothetical protein B0A63_26000 [Flavobacterium johnsoniae UW101]WDF61043.1 DUF4142 domain-containing protein [Flavobacterium sp. KACC 22758]WQG82854.1 DUF4142 domain-containing protein [Flavobacterium johnsoniae UW101]SHL59220.1 protein of unknown function [Flavobacterium johnsoniae]